MAPFGDTIANHYAQLRRGIGQRSTIRTTMSDMQFFPDTGDRKMAEIMVRMGGSLLENNKRCNDEVGAGGISHLVRHPTEENSIK